MFQYSTIGFNIVLLGLLTESFFVTAVSARQSTAFTCLLHSVGSSILSHLSAAASNNNHTTGPIGYFVVVLRTTRRATRHV